MFQPLISLVGYPTIMPQLLQGEKINVVSIPPHTIFFDSVPKQMLIHFCGYNFVSRRLCTSRSGTQELRLPSEHCERLGLQYVILWMFFACRKPLESRQLNVPKYDIVLACNVARALRVLACHADASRVDRFLKRAYFDRPLNAVKVKQMCLARLPPNGQYMQWMINNVDRSMKNEWASGPLPSSFRRNLYKAMEYHEWVIEEKGERAALPPRLATTVPLAKQPQPSNWVNRASNHLHPLRAGHDKGAIFAWALAVEYDMEEMMTWNDAVVNGELVGGTETTHIVEGLDEEPWDQVLARLGMKNLGFEEPVNEPHEARDALCNNC